MSHDEAYNENIIQSLQVMLFQNPEEWIIEALNEALHRAGSESQVARYYAPER